MGVIAQAARFTIQSFKPYQKKTLRGFLDVATPSGMIIHGVTLHENGRSRWIGLPARQFEKDEKTGWAPIVEFVDRDAADRFRDGVLEAFDRFQPNPSEIAEDE
jgi:DNA-binding cell septation regulator SpoVG